MKLIRLLICFAAIIASTHAIAEDKNNPLWQKMVLMELHMLEKEGIAVDYDKYYVDYIRYFDFNDDVSFKEVIGSDNELKILKHKDDIIAHLTDTVRSIDPKTTVFRFYKSKVDFEEYDTELNAFKGFHPFNQYHGIVSKEGRLLSKRDEGTFFYESLAMFTNNDFVDSIPVDLDTAADFLDALPKDKSNGEIRRLADVEVLAVPSHVAYKKYSRFDVVVMYEIIGYRAFGRDGDFRGKEVGRKINTEKLAQVLGAQADTEVFQDAPEELSL